MDLMMNHLGQKSVGSVGMFMPGIDGKMPGG
jgi:hypothetical protein